MDQYPSNSRNAREEAPAKEEKPEKVEKIISGGATLRKKPMGRRIHEKFFGTAGNPGIWGNIVNQVMVPALKDLASDMVVQTVERALFGESRSDRRRSVGGGRDTYVAYNRIRPATIHDRRDDRRPDRDDRRDTSIDFQEVVLDSRVDAERARERLYEYVDRFGTATIADLYDLLGLRASYIDKQWGWTTMSGTSIVRLNDGRYLLDLPTPERL